MKKHTLVPIFVLSFLVFWIISISFLLYGGGQHALAQDKGSKTEAVKLPLPRYNGDVSVEKALLERRSLRSYRDEPLTLPEISQILWAAQGITEPGRGLRTAPSARVLYLLNVYLLSGNVTNLPIGMYKYQPRGHELIKISGGDKKAELFNAVGQAPIKNAPAVLVFSGMSERSTNPRWMYVEAGHAAQNVYLQAIPLKLGAVVIGGFKDEDVRRALNMSEKEQPIYIMPVGKK
ncbi:MAG: SagB/ThcOx family dehydrogenase [Proteobacteria bacterium]|nr:SagB/ThcOx family dehydrogenase [Pseudomonadota bacterium]